MTCSSSGRATMGELEKLRAFPAKPYVCCRENSQSVRDADAISIWSHTTTLNWPLKVLLPRLLNNAWVWSLGKALGLWVVLAFTLQIRSNNQAVLVRGRHCIALQNKLFTLQTPCDPGNIVPTACGQHSWFFNQKSEGIAEMYRTEYSICLNQFG